MIHRRKIKRHNRKLTLQTNLSYGRLKRKKGGVNENKYPKFWLYGKTTRTVLGYFENSKDAYNYGLSHFDEPFKVIPLNTINRHEASAKIKGKRISSDRIKVRQAVNEKMHHKDI